MADLELHKTANIENAMKEAYLEYAMSVIVGRALPDVRDGLKPVHRRILYSMHNLNMAFNKPYVKSARVVGDVVGKYHPHGDTAVYDSIVRMAQNFSLRYPFIDGQGNFGSVDGDAPAAMRYTEVRFKKIAEELLVDIEKDTIDFQENYDGSLKEPKVLPARVPSLLINGSTGIAVGMATNIPPHNLKEIVRALLYLIENRDIAEPADLTRFIQGPDFPTGGSIIGRRGIYSALETGRGSIQIRSTTHVEDISGNRQAIIVTEIPYAVNKTKLIERIVELIKNKQINGIGDIRDESDRSGMRIVLELKKGELVDPIFAYLYKHSQLQTSFGIILLAVVDNQPRVLSMMQALNYFIDHRIEIINRRTAFDLEKAEDRIHILYGLKIALDNIDQVVETIRAAEGTAEAKQALCSRFSLSEKQAQAILEMRLQRLTGMERGKINAEIESLTKDIERYKAILADENLALKLIKEELQSIGEEYGDERKTKIVDSEEDIDPEDMIPEEVVVITLSNSGYIKRVPADTYRSQKRGGKGKIAVLTKDDDFLKQLVVASTHDHLLLFTNKGKVYWKRGFEIPLASRIAKGRAIINFLPLQEDEEVMSILPVKNFEGERSVIMITKNGTIKKSAIQDYSNKRTNGSKAILIDDDDQLLQAKLADETQMIFIATLQGLSLKFPVSKLRSQGRVTRGSRGIKLREKGDLADQVVSLEIISEQGTILTVTEKGYGKKSQIASYRLGNRANSGVFNIKITARNGQVVSSLGVVKGDEILLISQKGKIVRLETDQISTMGRITQGVRLIQLEEDERLIAVAKMVDLDTEADSESVELPIDTD